ncbi:putative membrane protein insertion efficiency factor [compost metagenome]
MMNLSKRWIGVSSLLEKTFKYSLWFFVAAYRSIGTTHLGGACRFTPSCSEYALDAIKTYPTHKALGLITLRLCKCRPGGPCGYDPVPEPKGKTS